MIEFTLSKINLLILVVALFAIISFFSLNVAKIFLVGEVKQELDTFSSTLNVSIASPTTCDSKFYSIPDKFTSFGNNVFYKLYISQVPDPQLGTRLIFSAIDIRQPTTILAASSLSTMATVVIYERNTDPFNPSPAFIPIAPESALELDPQSVPPRNSFYAIKSVKGGIATLYILPCTITGLSETCTSNKSTLRDILQVSGEAFVC